MLLMPYILVVSVPMLLVIISIPIRSVIFPLLHAFVSFNLIIEIFFLLDSLLILVFVI